MIIKFFNLFLSFAENSIFSGLFLTLTNIFNEYSPIGSLLHSNHKNSRTLLPLQSLKTSSQAYQRTYLTKIASRIKRLSSYRVRSKSVAKTSRPSDNIACPQRRDRRIDPRKFDKFFNKIIRLGVWKDHNAIQESAGWMHSNSIIFHFYQKQNNRSQGVHEATTIFSCYT